jgi:hypothetical protein
MYKVIFLKGTIRHEKIFSTSELPLILSKLGALWYAGKIDEYYYFPIY